MGHGAHHPNIWKFIEGIKEQQSLTEVKVALSFYACIKYINCFKKNQVSHFIFLQLAIAKTTVEDQPMPTKRRRFVNLAKKIKTVVSEYETRTTDEFFKGIVSCIRFE